MVHTVEEMIAAYVAAWNKDNLNDFQIAFAEIFAAGATYTDPTYPMIRGVAGISGLAQASLEKIPGRVFSMITLPQHHNHSCLYTWGVAIPGMGQREGQDYIEFNDDFHITRLVSFFKPL